MKNAIIAISLFLSWASPSSAHAAEKFPVTIQVNNVAYKGTLFVPSHQTESLPLVVVVHEWWGKNDYANMRAAKIADELGHAALAVDLFGEGKTAENPEDAGKLAGPFYLDTSKAIPLLQAFITAAKDKAVLAKTSINSEKIAAIGYCFGGSQVLNLARNGDLPNGDKLLGVVSFHGGLNPLLKPKGVIRSKVLVLNGAADKMVKAADIKTFKAEMKTAKAKLTFKDYPGALHAFTNPKATEVGLKFKMPVAYDEKADKDSWKRMAAFLSGLFVNKK